MRVPGKNRQKQGAREKKWSTESDAEVRMEAWRARKMIGEAEEEKGVMCCLVKPLLTFS